MIDLHYAPTPNGWKISIMLEELGLPYHGHSRQHPGRRAVQAGISGDQPEQPHSGDRGPCAGRWRRAVFGVRDRCDPDLSGRQDRALSAEGNAGPLAASSQWLMWQMSGLGPMLGQHGHFALYAQEKIPYAIERYRDEAARLYRVLDTQLGKTGAYVAGEYSIADIACFPWTMTHKAQGFTLDDYPNVKRWYARCARGRRCRRGLRSENSSRSRSTRRRGRTCSGNGQRRWRGGEVVAPAVIACDKRKVFAQGSVATKQSILS